MVSDDSLIPEPTVTAHRPHAVAVGSELNKTGFLTVAGTRRRFDGQSSLVKSETVVLAGPHRNERERRDLMLISGLRHSKAGTCGSVGTKRIARKKMVTKNGVEGFQLHFQLAPTATQPPILLFDQVAGRNGEWMLAMVTSSG